MAIGAPNLRSVGEIEKSLAEILNLGLQKTPPEHPMLLLDDLFQEGLREKLREVKEGIMSQVAPTDPTKIEPRRWTATVDPSSFFEKGEILLLNTPNRDTDRPSKAFSAVFTKKHMEELVNNRKGRVIWYVVVASSMKNRIA